MAVTLVCLTSMDVVQFNSPSEVEDSFMIHACVCIQTKTQVAHTHSFHLVMLTRVTYTTLHSFWSKQEEIDIRVSDHSFHRLEHL